MKNLFKHILDEANRKKTKQEIDDFNKILKAHLKRKKTK